MSPACEQRAKWMEGVLRDMGRGVLGVLFGGEGQGEIGDKEEEEGEQRERCKEEEGEQFRWELIYLEGENPRNRDGVVELEVVGKSVSLKG